MTLDEFRATARPVSDETWEAITCVGAGYAPREAYTQYAEEDAGFVLHEKDGKFWPHAWWYAPVPYATKAEAEAVLFNWRAEFA